MTTCEAHDCGEEPTRDMHGTLLCAWCAGLVEAAARRVRDTEDVRRSLLGDLCVDSTQPLKTNPPASR